MSLLCKVHVGHATKGGGDCPGTSKYPPSTSNTSVAGVTPSVDEDAERGGRGRERGKTIRLADSAVPAKPLSGPGGDLVIYPSANGSVSSSAASSAASDADVFFTCQQVIPDPIH